MNPVKQVVVERLWRGVDPMLGFPHTLIEADVQGWNSEHPYLAHAITQTQPQIIVELGVWKGASTLFMAEELRRSGHDGVVIAVDTWLGSREHWVRDEYFGEVGFLHGYPTLYYKFLANVARSGLGDYVVPLPLDSLNAARVLQDFGLSPGLIHLDGGHDYDSVMADLKAWWPLLVQNGILVGDDYYTNGQWSGVRRAYDEFFDALGMSITQEHEGKCWIRKPLAPTEAAAETA